MATSQSRRLDASAKPYVREAMPFVPLETYMGPPPGALPPPGFYPLSGFMAPPPPGLPGASLGCWVLPQAPCLGMQSSSPHLGWAPPMPVPMAMSAAPAPPGMQCAPQPQLPGMTATPHGGRHRPSRYGPGPIATQPPRLELPPRMQRAAGRAAPSSPRGPKGDPANEPSPRSVLVQTSPPDTLSELPTLFPYPELGSPSPPASVAAPSSVSVPAAGSQPVVPPQRRQCERAPRLFRLAAGGTVRPSIPKPRRYFDPSSSGTSLMIRNIPIDFRRTRLMHIIDKHCTLENDKITSGGVKSEYDFLYLPMDFRTGFNLGYAFVNLTTPEAARRLWDYLHGHRWTGSGKTCEVDHAYIEGRQKLVENFSDSRFDCGDEEFLPVWFEPARDGSRTPLPHLVGRMLRRS